MNSRWLSIPGLAAAVLAAALGARVATAQGRESGLQPEAEGRGSKIEVRGSKIGNRDPRPAIRDPRSSIVETDPQPPTLQPLSPRRESGKTPASSSGSFWKTISTLAVILVLLWLVGRYLKQRGTFGNSAAADGALEVLTRRWIDQRQSICVVRLGSRILVLGSSPAGLQTLAEIADPLEVDLLTGMFRGNGNGGRPSIWSLFGGSGGSRSQAEPGNERRSRFEDRDPPLTTLGPRSSTFDSDLRSTAQGSELRTGSAPPVPAGGIGDPPYESSAGRALAEKLRRASVRSDKVQLTK